MTIVPTAHDEDDVVVVPEAQLEEGQIHNDAIPVAATAVVAEPVDSTADHALTASNRFVPVAVASALPEQHPNTVAEEEEDGQRPDLLSATVYKRSRGSPVGIALRDNANVGVVVKHIEPAGLFAVSSFQAGDKLMSVNSESCEGLDSKGVADLIRNTENILTVVVRAPNGRADRVSSMVMKESFNARVGIGFRKHGEELAISSIAEDGIFAHSLLNVSDTCLSINGIACTSDTDATTAVELIRTSPSFVTILAKTRHTTGVVVAASAVSGPTAASNGVSATESPPTAAATTATTTFVSQQHDPTDSRRKACYCVVGIFAIIFIAIVAVKVSSQVDSYDTNDDYYGSLCTWIDCRVCDRYCYSEFCRGLLLPTVRWTACCSLF